MICQVPGQSESAEFAADEDARSLDPSSSESPHVTAADAAIHRSFLPIFPPIDWPNESIDAYASRINRSLMSIQISSWSDASSSCPRFGAAQLRHSAKDSNSPTGNDADKVAARRTAQIVRLIDGLPKLIIAQESQHDVGVEHVGVRIRALAQFLKPIINLLVGLVSGPLADDRSHAALVALLLKDASQVVTWGIRPGNLREELVARCCFAPPIRPRGGGAGPKLRNTARPETATRRLNRDVRVATSFSAIMHLTSCPSSMIKAKVWVLSRIISSLPTIMAAWGRGVLS